MDIAAPQANARALGAAAVHHLQHSLHELNAPKASIGGAAVGVTGYLLYLFLGRKPTPTSTDLELLIDFPEPVLTSPRLSSPSPVSHKLLWGLDVDPIKCSVPTFGDLYLAHQQALANKAAAKAQAEAEQARRCHIWDGAAQDFLLASTPVCASQNVTDTEPLTRPWSFMLDGISQVTKLRWFPTLSSSILGMVTAVSLVLSFGMARYITRCYRSQVTFVVRVKEMLSEFPGLKANLNTASTKHEKLDADVLTAILNRIATLEAANKSCSKQLQSSSQMITDLEASNKSKSNQIALLQAQNETNEKQMADFKANIKANSNKISMHDEQIFGFRNNNNAFNSRIVFLETSNKNVTAQVEKLLKSIHNGSERIEVLASDVSRLIPLLDLNNNASIGLQTVEEENLGSLSQDVIQKIAILTTDVQSLKNARSDRLEHIKGVVKALGTFSTMHTDVLNGFERRMKELKGDDDFEGVVNAQIVALASISRIHGTVISSLPPAKFSTPQFYQAQGNNKANWSPAHGNITHGPASPSLRPSNGYHAPGNTSPVVNSTTLGGVHIGPPLGAPTGPRGMAKAPITPSGLSASKYGPSAKTSTPSPQSARPTPPHSGPYSNES